MLSLQESNALQRDLIENFCEAEGLDKKSGALKWCTDGHAEQCRKLINLGFHEEHINNFFIEVMMLTKSRAEQLVDLSLIPLKLFSLLTQRDKNTASNYSSI